jgi:signal peptidase I
MYASRGIMYVRHRAEKEKGHYVAKSSPIRAVLEIAIIIVAAVVLAFCITNFVAQPYEIPSGSMEDTIEIGDRVFSEKVSSDFNNPERGDIVTFKDVTNQNRVLIKRVIATGGQTVDLIDGTVYVNGVALSEPYTQGKPSYDLKSGIVYPYTIPDGYIWVMGDNRTNSSDSRAFGAIPVSNITGHAFFRYWPLNRIGSL